MLDCLQQANAFGLGRVRLIIRRVQNDVPVRQDSEVTLRFIDDPALDMPPYATFEFQLVPEDVRGLSESSMSIPRAFFSLGARQRRDARGPRLKSFRVVPQLPLAQEASESVQRLILETDSSDASSEQTPSTSLRRSNADWETCAGPQNQQCDPDYIPQTTSTSYEDLPLITEQDDDDMDEWDIKIDGQLKLNAQLEVSTHVSLLNDHIEFSPPLTPCVPRPRTSNTGSVSKSMNSSWRCCASCRCVACSTRRPPLSNSVI
jgi:hypothetical protein